MEFKKQLFISLCLSHSYFSQFEKIYVGFDYLKGDVKLKLLSHEVGCMSSTTPTPPTASVEVSLSLYKTKNEFYKAL